MVGETNVAIAVGQGGTPDLPTAIGSPLSVYYAAVINNQTRVKVDYGAETFIGPDIKFYELDYPAAPALAGAQLGQTTLPPVSWLRGAIALDPRPGRSF